MPSILLINDNKIVSRLLQLSSQKHNYTIEEISDYNASENAYNVIFVDSEKYDSEAWEALKSTLTYDKLGFIAERTSTKPEDMELLLEKPFLPTDFVALMDENFKVMPQEDAVAELDEMESLGEDEELNLEDIDEIDLEIVEEIEELEEIVVEDETLDAPATTLTTGIVDSLEKEQTEEISNIVDEIEDMESIEPLEEMDLEELVDEKVSESLQEVEEAIKEEEMLAEEEIVSEEIIEEETVEEETV